MRIVTVTYKIPDGKCCRNCNALYDRYHRENSRVERRDGKMVTVIADGEGFECGLFRKQLAFKKRVVANTWGNGQKNKCTAVIYKCKECLSQSTEKGD